MATDYFVEGYPGKDSDITNWFAGIVTENVEQLQEFKETVNDKVNPGDVLIVTGNTLEQAETVANWLLSEFTLELRNIGYTTLFENSVYDIATKEPILFETKESIENDENLTAEPPILKEKKEKQQSEDETVSLEESENTGENKTIGKNGVAENESSSEETRLLKEIVIEAEETGGNRSYKATTKTVNSAVPSILEEEKKKYISTYQKMIVSGKTYAASAYLKALAKQHPYFEPFYRQLAYAVNDPMERCTYSSDTIFNVFYGDTVPISDYYIVAAALRNYFFDQYSYDYSIQQLSGGYKEGTYKYYYIDFLKSDKVLLDEDFLPILDEVLELPDFSIMSRIQSHCDENETDLSDRLQKIFAGDDDYGSASLILKYFDCQGKNLSSEEYEKYNIEKAIVYPLRDLENKRKEFIEDIELAQSYGQIIDC